MSILKVSTTQQPAKIGKAGPNKLIKTAVCCKHLHSTQLGRLSPMIYSHHILTRAFWVTPPVLHCLISTLFIRNLQCEEWHNNYLGRFEPLQVSWVPKMSSAMEIQKHQYLLWIFSATIDYILVQLMMELRAHLCQQSRYLLKCNSQLGEMKSSCSFNSSSSHGMKWLT